MSFGIARGADDAPLGRLDLLPEPVPRLPQAFVTRRRRLRSLDRNFSFPCARRVRFLALLFALSLEHLVPSPGCIALALAVRHAVLWMAAGGAAPGSEEEKIEYPPEKRSPSRVRPTARVRRLLSTQERW